MELLLSQDSLQSHFSFPRTASCASFIAASCCLLKLAACFLISSKRSSLDDIAPGKWLSKLETFARERELPGIRMYAALLKAELYENNDQLGDAVATLKEGLTISDSLGVRTLRKRLSDRIQELNLFMREEAVSSEKRSK